MNDEHYEELHRMEEQLKTFRTLAGEPYQLLALPMADKIEVEGERLPATYANFLIMNDAVLYPTYNQPENDIRAKEVLQEAFPGHEIVGIDCRALNKTTWFAALCHDAISDRSNQIEQKENIQKKYRL